MNNYESRVAAKRAGWKAHPNALDTTKPFGPFTPVDVKDLKALNRVDVAEAKGIQPGNLIIDLASGLPVKEATGETCVDIPLDSPVSFYTQCWKVDWAYTFLFIIIATEARTTFVAVLDDVAFTFDLDVCSESPLEAIANLYGDCLEQGEEAYEGMMEMLPHFFYKLFAATSDGLSDIKFTVTHGYDEPVSLRLYLYPEEPNKNILSSNGYCWHVDLDAHPKKQIARGFSLRRREERKKEKRNL